MLPNEPKNWIETNNLRWPHGHIYLLSSDNLWTFCRQLGNNQATTTRGTKICSLNLFVVPINQHNLISLRNYCYSFCNSKAKNVENVFIKVGTFTLTFDHVSRNSKWNNEYIGITSVPKTVTIITSVPKSVTIKQKVSDIESFTFVQRSIVWSWSLITWPEIQ